MAERGAIRRRAAGPVPVIAAAVLALWVSSARADDQTVEVIPVVHRTAKDLLPVVAPLLSPEGHVSADTRSNSLVVVDTPDRVKDIQEVVRQMDRSVQKLRLAIRLLEVEPPDPEDPEALEEDPSVPPVPAQEGDGETAPMVTGQYFISLDSGGSTTLTLRQDDPSRFFWSILSRRHGLVGYGVSFDRVDTGFDIDAAEVGDAFRIGLTPVIHAQTPGGRLRPFRFAESRSQLRVQPGQWVTAAGSEVGSDPVTQSVLDAARRSRSASVRLEVRVDVF